MQIVSLLGIYFDAAVFSIYQELLIFKQIGSSHTVVSLFNSFKDSAYACY